MKIINMRKIPLTLFILSAFILSLSLVYFAEAAAASLYLEPGNNSYDIDETFSLDLRLDTGGATISVAEATLTFPVDKFELKSVSKNGSIFGLWTEEPTFSDNTISFAGGVIGGFTGVGTVYSVTFQAKASGIAEVTLSQARVLSFAAEPINILESTSGGVYTILEALVSEELLPEEEVPLVPEEEVPPPPRPLFDILITPVEQVRKGLANSTLVVIVILLFVIVAYIIYRRIKKKE